MATNETEKPEATRTNRNRALQVWSELGYMKRCATDPDSCVAVAAVIEDALNDAYERGRRDGYGECLRIVELRYDEIWRIGITGIGDRLQELSNIMRRIRERIGRDNT